MMTTDADLDFESLLPDAPFGEFHARTIEAPVDKVWAAFNSVTAPEIRLLAPLLAARALPSVLLRKRPALAHGTHSSATRRPVLELFADEGFVMLRRDDRVVNGRATVIFGAAGKFWSPAHNAPVDFASPQAFLDVAEPGMAKTVARFDAVAEGPARTRLETETLVDVPSPDGRRKFAAYWAIIRGPSGLLRRSWLAAVDRRATR